MRLLQVCVCVYIIRGMDSVVVELRVGVSNNTDRTGTHPIANLRIANSGSRSLPNNRKN